MKKFFGGKKKKKTKAASFISADSDYQVNDVVPRKLKVSLSTEQPRLPLSNDISNLEVNTVGKNLMHSKSQGIMKTTIPTQQPAMAKRLNRPTSSPPALVMPRPRYAEPPTRAVLKSFDHEKTQLDLDNGTAQQNRKDDNIDSNSNTHQIQQDQVIQVVPSISAPIPTKLKKISPTTALPQQHDTSKSTIKSKKSFDGAIAMATAKKHESMNSITGSDDSNRVYESALESPMASTSTILDNTGSTHGAAFGLGQAQRHSSPINFNPTLVPSLLPPTASDSSETVTPAGSTNQYQRVSAPEHVGLDVFNSIDITKSVPQNSNIVTSPKPAQHQRPQPISPTRNHHDLEPSLQQILPSEDLETLQQQVLLIQQQREMDRLEYERMEQIHKERTKWMKAEIDRTQSKLMELTAQKRGYMASQQQQPENEPLPTPTFNDHQTDILMSNPHHSNGVVGRESGVDGSSRRHYENHHSSASSTPSRQQKSRPNLSRSSSKTSTGSSIGRSGHRSKVDIKSNHPHLDTRPIEDERQRAGPSQPDLIPGDPYMNDNLSRQTSGRRSQQSQRQEHQQQQQQQNASSLKGASSTSRSRQTRPRSKSTESRPQPPPPVGPEMDYYYDEPQILRSRARPSVRRHQRSQSVERPHSFHPGNPYFYPPNGFEEGMEDEIDEDDEVDEDEDDYLETDYRYHPPWYDSFPPRQQQRVRQYPPPPPPMPGPFIPYRPRMAPPSRMHQGYYDYEGGPYYPAPMRRRPEMAEDDYWQSAGAGPFGRYPPYMRMEEPQRRMGPYWRGRTGHLSPTEFSP